jgi:hypothetical protein
LLIFELNKRLESAEQTQKGEKGCGWIFGAIFQPEVLPPLVAASFYDKSYHQFPYNRSHCLSFSGINDNTANSNGSFLTMFKNNFEAIAIHRLTCNIFIGTALVLSPEEMLKKASQQQIMRQKVNLEHLPLQGRFQC